MSGSEPTPETHEVSTSRSESNSNGTGTEGHVQKTQHVEVDISKGDEQDEFGLPITQKPVRHVRYEYDSNEEQSGKDEQPKGDLPKSIQIDSKQTVKDKPREQSQDNGDKAGSPQDPVPAKVSDDGDQGQSRNGTKTETTAPAEIGDVLHGHTGAASGWSHQALAPQKVESDRKVEDDDWKEMPAYAPFDLYDDDGKLIAREAHESDEEPNAYSGLGGAGKGYTRVQLDEDAKSTTSMEEHTDYLFKSKKTEAEEAENFDEDEEPRDPMAQLQATKDLLTEGQRIAYVGVTRLTMAKMIKEFDDMDSTKKTKKGKVLASESLKMWSQQMMVRLYLHMEINSSEQIMIEQLAEHGVEPADLTPALMQNARVKNPMAEETQEETKRESEEILTSGNSSLKSPPSPKERRSSAVSSRSHAPTEDDDLESLPPYKEHEEDTVPQVRQPEDLGKDRSIDIDIRWTILCDLFLVLLSDSMYDSRSRTLLEQVGEALSVSWTDICRFEKRVTDSLEMEQEKNKETWDEAEHVENRRKQALKRRYMMMGLATVGGSLVIGLSAGALAPVIGAGLAAGFTTIGVAGTSGFLAGAGGTAIITSGAVVAGGSMGIRASHRRTGAVRTFEYRPLHNNKRVNLIVTISGWMNGKVDDVRLPFSTIDPVMGDIYSLLWEPEMLQSMGDTIRILASEALSQTIQQVLGSTILIALMASLQLPIVLSKLTYLIDNPWTVSMGRANAAGLILADSLVDRNLGARPITLVGFSLGARVIFAALRELASRGAFGIIQNVFLFGSPVVANKDEYLRARSVVSGRFVNAYASNDWILGYLFRATSGGIMRVAGLAPVEGIAGVENHNVTSLVNGHMAYRAAMPKLLRLVGWEIESDEFTEIEDPDPENHEKRQRELIKEINDARTQAEQKPGKRRFGLFRRGKLAEKKGWETYDDKSMKSEDDFGTAAAEGAGANIFFDVEAIKRELASEHIDVKELQSTAPPMKISINDFKKPEEDRSPPTNPYAGLRETKSYDGTSTTSVANASKPGGTISENCLPNGQSQKENPFNQGYDEYNLSAESVEHRRGSEQSKPSFDLSQSSSSPKQSPPYSLDSKVNSSAGPHEVERQPPTQTASERPVLASSNSAPTGSSGMSADSPPAPAQNISFEHNAWVDAEDEDFGREKEVTMTFG